MTVLAMDNNDQHQARRDQGQTERHQDEGIVLTPEQQRARRSRSITLALALVALVVLFYIVTLVKGPGILVRPL